MQTLDLEQRLSLHKDLGLMFLEKARESENIGNFEKALEFALYAWSHFRLGEHYTDLVAVTRDYIKNPFYPACLDYNFEEILQISQNFSDYAQK